MLLVKSIITGDNSLSIISSLVIFDVTWVFCFLAISNNSLLDKF